MSFLRKLLLFGCFVVLCSGKGSKHSIWFVVSNSSADAQSVDMKFSIAGKSDAAVVLTERRVPPGLQQLPEKKLKEGVYNVQVTANQGKLGATQPFTLDSDRWVLINYVTEDSASIIKSYGYIDPARFKKINGKYATIYISVASRKPAGF